MRLLALSCFAILGCATSNTWDGDAHRLCEGRDCYNTGALGPAWTVLEHTGGEIGFYNADKSAVIQSNMTCRDDAEATPLVSLTQHLLIGYSEAHHRSAEVVPFAGREALHSIVEAKLDGVPLVLDLYVMKRNGCIFDLSLAAPPEHYAAGVVDFQRFVDGFGQRKTGPTENSMVMKAGAEHAGP